MARDAADEGFLRFQVLPPTGGAPCCIAFFMPPSTARRSGASAGWACPLPWPQPPAWCCFWPAARPPRARCSARVSPSRADSAYAGYPASAGNDGSVEHPLDGGQRQLPAALDRGPGRQAGPGPGLRRLADGQRPPLRLRHLRLKRRRHLDAAQERLGQHRDRHRERRRGRLVSLRARHRALLELRLGPGLRVPRLRRGYLSAAGDADTDADRHQDGHADADAERPPPRPRRRRRRPP